MVQRPATSDERLQGGGAGHGRGGIVWDQRPGVPIHAGQPTDHTDGVFCVDPPRSVSSVGGVLLSAIICAICGFSLGLVGVGAYASTALRPCDTPPHCRRSSLAPRPRSHLCRRAPRARSHTAESLRRVPGHETVARRGLRAYGFLGRGCSPTERDSVVTGGAQRAVRLPREGSGRDRGRAGAARLHSWLLPYRYLSSSSWNRGWSRRGSQAGSRRSSGTDSLHGMDKSSSSRSIAFPRSPTWA